MCLNDNDNHGERVVSTLRKYYIDNDYEIPSIEEKEKLAEKLGVTAGQISDWYKHGKRKGRLPSSNSPFAQEKDSENSVQKMCL